MGRAWSKLLRHRMGAPGAVILIAYVAVALLAPWLTSADPDAVNLRAVMRAPSVAHPFGTDQFGRDIFTRVIYGARTSLLLGCCVVALATAVGVVLGAIAGYFGGAVDRATTFVTDVFMSLPSLIVALGVITALGAGLTSTIAAVAIAATPRMIRVARAAVLAIRALDYVESCRTIGLSPAAILLRHVVPNALAPVIVQASLLMAEAILVAAGLGFLGLGVPPPTAEWGQMLAEGRGYLRTAPFVSVFPGLAIALLVLGLNLLGDGLRDALDVRT